MERCLTLYGDAAAAHIAAQSSQTNKPPPVTDADHPHLDGDFAAIVARKLPPIRETRRKVENVEGDADPYAAARCAAQSGQPNSRPLAGKTYTHRQTVLHGDGDSREGMAIAEGQVAAQYGRIDLSGLWWHFGPTQNPWAGKHPPAWCLPLFAEQADWIARIDFGSTNKQRRHAMHLAGQVAGRITNPWASRLPDSPDAKSNMREREHDLIASALLRFYGADPVPAFLEAMASAQIIPDKPSDAIRYCAVATFDIQGEPRNTRNGWAILHRCPGAGCFGNWRTGAAHKWHAQPERMEEADAQFKNDLALARLSRPKQLIAA